MNVMLFSPKWEFEKIAREAIIRDTNLVYLGLDDLIRRKYKEDVFPMSAIRRSIENNQPIASDAVLELILGVLNESPQSWLLNGTPIQTQASPCFLEAIDAGRLRIDFIVELVPHDDLRNARICTRSFPRMYFDLAEFSEQNRAYLDSQTGSSAVIRQYLIIGGARHLTVEVGRSGQIFGYDLAEAIETLNNYGQAEGAKYAPQLP